MEVIGGQLKGFMRFVREQGVVGLAVGLVLGTAIKSLVDSMVFNILNPIIGIFLGGVALENKFWCLKSVNEVCVNKLAYGAFISSVISFMVIAAVVYFGVMGLRLDKLDLKKDEAKETKKK